MSTVASAKAGLFSTAGDYVYATQHGDQVAAGSCLCLSALRYALSIVKAAGRVGMDDPISLLTTLAGDSESP